MKKFALLLLVFTLLLSLAACVGQNGAAVLGTGSADAETVTSAAPTESVAPLETVAPSETVSPTEPDAPTEPTEPTLPSETREDLEAEALRAEMEALFDEENAENPWYLQALTSYFDCPEQVNLREFFFNGLLNEVVRDLTEEDIAALNEQGCYPLHGYVLNKSGMDRALESVFGLKLEDLRGVGMDSIYSLPGEDEFYIEPDGANGIHDLVIHSLEVRDDGSVWLRVSCWGTEDPDQIWTVVMVRDGDRWLIRANLPGEGTEEELLKWNLEELFSCQVSFYNLALASVYADPADVDLYPFFYNGIPGLDRIQEEVGQCECMPRAEMDRVLSRYFGLTLEETAGRGLENFYYDAETDCCYHSHSDACSLAVRVDDVRKLEDGTVLFTYCNLDYCYYHNEDGLIWTAGLKPDGEGNYQFLFNLLGEWVTPEDLGE